MVDQQELAEVLEKLGYNNYEALVEEFQHNVYSTVYSFTGNKTDAEDLSQEVFLLIYKNLSSFKSDAKLSTWIYKITVNRCLQFRRKIARRKDIARLVPISKEMEENLANGVLVDAHVIKNEEKNVLKEALGLINKKYSLVLTLHYMQELSIKEIGQILELSSRTVETQLYRARKKIKVELEELGYVTEVNV